MKESIKKSKLNLNYKERLGSYCRLRKKIGIRVLGLPTDEYPEVIEYDWAEVLGDLKNKAGFNGSRVFNQI